MKLFKIVEKRNLWTVLSLIVILSGFIVMGNRALKSEPVMNYGIDFVGGNSMILSFDALNSQETPSSESNIAFIGKLRNELKDYGLDKSTIQITQNREVIIKTLQIENSKNQAILDGLRGTFGSIEVLEIDFIGPTIGSELREKSIWIIILVSVSLLLYISWRFELRFGLAALAALLHDALVVISFSAIFNLEVNTAFVAAILTILGYSINDTIVIFDRIRENLQLYADTRPIKDVVNISLSQTLIRTLNTSVTTIAVISSLIFFGGTTIKEFCVVLLIGIIAGTYSSLFIASPVVASLSGRDYSDQGEVAA